MNNIIDATSKTIIESIITPFVSKISLKYNISKEDLLDELFPTSNSCLPVDTDKTPTCPYVFSRGKMSGTICSVSLKHGQSYCCKHIKKEKPLVNQTQPLTPDRLVLRKNKQINKLWHPTTKMVFGDNKVVIGKFQNGSLVDITREDEGVCKKMGFAFEKRIKSSTDIEELEELLDSIQHKDDYLSEEED